MAKGTVGGTVGEEITKKAFEYIDAIAANLGVATEYVFTILVRQQLAEGIAWLVIDLIIVFGGAYVVKLFFRGIFSKVEEILEKKKGRWYVTELHEDFILGSRWIVLTIYLVAVIITLFTLPHYITQVINPEYHAIMEILDALTGGSKE